MVTTSNPENRPPRSHVRITDAERREIRKKHRQCRTLTQKELAMWATDHFGRPISQSTISDSLQMKYAKLDPPVIIRAPVVEPPVVLPPLEPVTRCAICLNGPEACQCRRQSRQDLPNRTAAVSNRTVPVTIVPSEPAATSQRSLAITHTQRAHDLHSALSLPRNLNTSAIWFPRLLDAISTSTDVHRGSSMVQVDVIATWFSQLPSLIGKSSMLDDALRGFALGHVGWTLGDKAILQKGRIAYGHSIYALQRSLSSKNPVLSPETVTATMVLSLFELCTDSGTSDGWLNHANGASQILYLLDPSNFRNPMGRLLIKAFVGQWASYAFERNDFRLLESPEFHEAMWESTTDPHGAACEYSAHVEHGMHLWLRIFRGIRKVLSAKSPQEIGACFAEFVELQTTIAKNLSEFRERDPPTEIPASQLQDDGDEDDGGEEEMFPTVYSYRNVCHVSAYMTYLTSLTGLNYMILRLKPDEQLRQRNEKLADDICKSVDYILASGFLGAAALAQPFRTLLIHSPERCEWIRGRLKRGMLGRGVKGSWVQA